MYTYNHDTLTVPGSVPQPPVVDTDTITTTTAVITWPPPTDPNGVVIRYTVQYIAVGIAGSSQRRKRRQTGSELLPECIYGGVEKINRTQDVPGTETSLTLNQLSELDIM